jgi:hypothetical protein
MRGGGAGDEKALYGATEECFGNFLFTALWPSLRIVDTKLVCYDFTIRREDEMATRRRTYTKEFKTEAVRLVTERDYSKSPDQLESEHVKQYLLHIVQEKKRSWGTYNQALAALRYFYRWVVKGPEVVRDIRCPRPERHLPVVLSCDEVRRFFAVSRVFRGKFIALLKRTFARGELEFHGSLASLAEPAAMERLLNQSVKNDWVVYAKRPFGGPKRVLKYLALYTHRVALSNGRLLRLEDGQVTLAWKDYAHGNRWSTMTLTAVEFIRRFLLHVLPTSFVNIRYYGFM